MGDDDDRILEALEKTLQPDDGLDVEVVGRLVEQQDVGIAEQGLGQQDPDLVAAFQFLHLPLPHLLRDAEAAEQHRRLGFDLVAVHLGEFGLEFAAADAVLVGEFGSWRRGPRARR